MLRSQALSLKVMSAPVPGVLVLQAVKRSKNDASCKVTVKESQADSAGREKNVEGLPKAGPWAGDLVSEFQSSQEPSWECMAAGTLGSGCGGEVLVPKEEQDVMEPRVRRTMSAGWTWMMPWEPCLVKWISSTAILEESASESLVTFVSA